MNLECVRGRTHEYSDTETGRKYYSVSTVLDVIDNPFVGISSDVLESAQQRGTDLHYLFSFFLAYDRLNIGAKPDVPQHYEGYVHAMREWMEHTEVTPVAIERSSVNDKCGYAGTPDAMVKYSYGGKLSFTLVDLKTGQPHRRHRLQLAAYSKMDGYKEAKKLLTLYVHEDGTYKQDLFRPNTSDWHCFLSAINILNWRNSA